MELVKLAKFLKEVDPVIKGLAVIVSACAFIFTTFATVSYVDTKHSQAVTHADTNYHKNRDILIEVQGAIRTMDGRLWELQGRPASNPPVQFKRHE